jgi:hypothetical protein
MIRELIWEPDDRESFMYMTAPVDRMVRDNGWLILLYKGWDSSVAKHYVGKIKLALVNDTQTYEGEYEHEHPGAAKVAFTLVGEFIDQEMTSFEGRWIEPGYAAAFSF